MFAAQNKIEYRADNIPRESSESSGQSKTQGGQSLQHLLIRFTERLEEVAERGTT